MVSRQGSNAQSELLYFLSCISSCKLSSSTPCLPVPLAISNWKVSTREEAETPETLGLWEHRAQYTDVYNVYLKWKFCVWWGYKKAWQLIPKLRLGLEGALSHILKACSRSDPTLCLKKLEHPEQRRHGCGLQKLSAILTLQISCFNAQRWLWLSLCRNEVTNIQSSHTFSLKSGKTQVSQIWKKKSG